MRPLTAALLAATILIVVACTPSSPPSPLPAESAGVSPTPPATVAPATAPTPVATPSEAPPATPEPSPSEAANPAPPVAMTEDERALIEALRVDAATECGPRRTDLPAGARYGIECRPDDPQVARVGIYWFDSANAAAAAYMARMAEAGVTANAGDCVQDRPGDTPWVAGDYEGDVSDPGAFTWEGAVLASERNGCFLDENGTANVRATCGQTYVGILGTRTDLSELLDWAWAYPEGYEAGTPDAPGICIGEGVYSPDLAEVP
ncbi:MAG TPA: hypothetical protein VFY23_16995 [Candidatus Limnocylindrales bacterium]|nr:hypothetical protein [Candidatus Limnocylindrales bacterium]